MACFVWVYQLCAAAPSPPIAGLCRWDIFGAVIGTECGTLESGSAMVFLRDGERKICTPYMDTTGYGNLRFYFSMGEYKLLM